MTRLERICHRRFLRYMIQTSVVAGLMAFIATWCMTRLLAVAVFCGVLAVVAMAMTVTVVRGFYLIHLRRRATLASRRIDVRCFDQERHI